MISIELREETIVAALNRVDRALANPRTLMNDIGEEVVAFVVPAPGAVFDPAALDAHCLTRIARFKRPKAYFEIGELPKNNYGKVLKTALRKILEETA